MGGRHAARSPGEGRVSAAAIAIVVAGAGFVQSAAEAGGQTPSPPGRPAGVHVRGLDRQAAVLLGDGRTRSATLRHLCETIEQTDVVVLVQMGRVQTPAQTIFVGASPLARFLRITLTVPEMNDVLLGWLAHELQHAVEIASVPAIVSGTTMLDFYRRHGQTISSDGFCTREAQRARSAVTYELTEQHPPH